MNENNTLKNKIINNDKNYGEDLFLDSEGIIVKNLNFDYGEEDVVKNITTRFKKGSFISILGPNGSGKSTLVKIILGILKNQEGEIIIDGKKLSMYGPREKALKLSYVPQWTSMDYEFTVYDIVSMGRHPYINRFSEESLEDKKVIEEAMVSAGINNFKDKKITEISGGERQRTALARALCQDSEYIILDEPVNHLDIRYQVEILKTLKNKTKEKTVIAVMHDINLASMYSDYIVMLKEGRVVAQGNIDDVLTKENLKEVFGVSFKKISVDSEKPYYRLES